jgi:hypothetical protein
MLGLHGLFHGSVAMQHKMNRCGGHRIRMARDESGTRTSISNLDVRLVSVNARTGQRSALAAQFELATRTR